jgi:hypothetical protein
LSALTTVQLPRLKAMAAIMMSTVCILRAIRRGSAATRP